MDDVDEYSPMDSACFSSPGSQQSPTTPLSPSPSNPRWMKKFKLTHRSKDHNLCPDNFSTRSRPTTAYDPLITISSSAGKGACLAQTAKQWDTIIKQAKIDNKMTDVMKAAKFFHFGHVLRDPKPAKPAEAYVFIRRQSELEARVEVDGLPLPLQAFATEIRQKIRRRRNLGLVSLEPDDALPQPTVSSSSETPSHKLLNAPTELHGLQSGPNLQTSNTQRTVVRKFKSGHDLNYLKFAAEEDWNDSELIKGIGRVPVNQQIPEPIKPVDNKPWELPPDSWALRDAKYLLQKMISSDLTIHNLTILQSATSLPSLEDPEALQLKWKGETERTISVIKGSEIKRVHFKDIIMIKYNRTESKLLFQFSSDNSDKPEELLLVLLPVPDDVWQGLQTRCYSLIKGKPSKQRCDVEGLDFFEEKTKSLTNLRFKRASIAPVPNRPIPQVANRGRNIRHKPRKPVRPMFQTRLNVTPSLQVPDTTPIKVSSPAQKPSSQPVANPIAQPNTPSRSSPTSAAPSDNRKASKSDENDLGSNKNHLDRVGEGGAYISAAIVKVSDVEIEDNNAVAIEPEAENAAEACLYYKSSLRSGVPVPVRLNDLVVRLRSDKERENGGKRDKLDLFDGPWRILEFDLPKNTHGMRISTTKDKGNRDGSPSRSRFDKQEAKKMLKSKVRLGFPRDTRAVCLVEISRLLPVTKLENVQNGKLHASCWGVSELTAFKVLQSEMGGRKLEIFDARHQNVPVNTTEKTPSDTGEGAEDGVDENVDEETDGDEAELPMHVVELRSGIFVAIMEADPKAIDDGDSYLVEKLRSKRLRLFKLNAREVRNHKLKTDEEDPWVKLLLQKEPQLAVNRVVVSEYKVHWAGWPDEDDTWDIGKGNIAEGFIDEYHRLTDLLRDISIDTQVVNPRDMVFKDDLPKSGRGKLSVGSRRSTAFSAMNKEVNTRDGRVAGKDQDEDMLDEDDDIAIAKVVQASLDEARAEETKEQLKALQREMGVEAKQSGPSVVPDADTATEDDIIMAEVEELEREIADSYLGGCGEDEEDEM